MRAARAGFRTRVWLAAGIALVVGSFAWAGIGFGIAEASRADALDGLAGSARADERIVIVAIDEAFVNRGREDVFAYAELLEALATSGATTVVIAPDLIDLANPGIDADDFEHLVESYVERIGGVVLTAGEVRLSSPRDGSAIPRLVSRQLSSTVVDAADAVALDNVVLDAEESAVRTVPLLAETDGDERTLVPTVGIVALARAEQLPLSVVEVDGGLRLGHMEIPTEAEQRLRVAYAPELSPGGSAVVSAGELLDADTDDPDLADKIVIVGITDPDSTRVVATPVGDAGRSPAVFVQANVLNTLLTGQFLRPVPDGVVVALIVALAFGVALATLVVPLWATPLAPIVAAGGFWLGAGSIVGSGRLLDVVFALAGIASAFVAGIIGRVGLELAHRRRVSNMFSRYVPPEIARQLMEEGEADAAAAGQRLTVTVVFCDLRGFTPYCASVSAAEVKVMLDTFYEFSTEVILDHGGTVMQFVGDEVFAVFGAPIARDDHATAALACSVEWQQQQAAFAGRLEELGLAPVTYGIGVHSGEVVAAHVGSTHRRQYTVMGEAVNIGARLCSEAAAGDIVISGQALDAAGDTVRATALGPLSLKGVTARVEGHRVEFGPSGEPVLSGT